MLIFYLEFKTWKRDNYFAEVVGQTDSLLKQKMVESATPNPVSKRFQRNENPIPVAGADEKHSLQ